MELTIRKSIVTKVALGSLIVAACMVGCDQGEKLGAVSGKVTFQGKPLTAGVVMFSNPAKGIHMTAKLDEQGHYKVVMAQGAGLPPGDYQVTVNPPVFDAPTGAGMTPAQMPKFPNIPQKYRHPKTSGLSLTVTEDGATLDVDMRP